MLRGPQPHESLYRQDAALGGPEIHKVVLLLEGFCVKYNIIFRRGGSALLSMKSKDNSDQPAAPIPYSYRFLPRRMRIHHSPPSACFSNRLRAQVAQQNTTCNQNLIIRQPCLH